MGSWKAGQVPDDRKNAFCNTLTKAADFTLSVDAQLRRLWLSRCSTDLEGIAQGYVTVTPLHYDLTHDRSMLALSDAFR